MRYDLQPGLQHEEITLARAKNTERAAARRRARAAARAADRAADREPVETQPEPAAEEPRQPIFTPPRFREDVRLLPQLFRTRRALWIPVIILLVGFVLTFAFYRGMVPVELAVPVEMYIQFFFFPQALFTFFLAGFLAPRASYLIGFLMGVLNAALWAVLLFGLDIAFEAGMEPTMVAANFLMIGVIYGTLAAAFAAWYRNFLRRMSERGRARRAAREAEERARRRDERRSARRPAG
jgi:hypothetical protein